MIHRRGVLPVLVLLVLVIAGAVLSAVRGPAAQRTAPATATPAATAAERAVLSSLATVENAYDAGDVRRLCRPGSLVDPAVVRAQNAQAQDCESELESLMANVPRLRVTVRALRSPLRPRHRDRGDRDWYRRHGRLRAARAALADELREGADPITALAGTT